MKGRWIVERAMLGIASSALVFAGGAAMAQNKTAPAGTAVTDAFSGAMQDRSARSPDAALFVEKCAMCHRQLGMGTIILARRMDPAVAMLEKREDLTIDFVTQAARTGIGNMPRIQRGEVSDAQMKKIAHYLAKGNK